MNWEVVDDYGRSEWTPRRKALEDRKEAQRKIRIDGVVMLYRMKAPYVRSGKSVLGGLEYNEERDLVRCHECGGWFKSVAVHSAMKHNIPAAEYKKKHGLKRHSSLVCEKFRLACSNRMAASNHANGGTPLQLDAELRDRAVAALRSRPKERRGYFSGERRNQTAQCQAQLLDRIRKLAEQLGHTPSQEELRAAGLSRDTLVFGLNVKNFSEAVAMAGLTPNPLGARGKRYSREQVIELFRAIRSTYGREPNWSDIKRKLLPSYSSIRGHFGGFDEALEASR